MALTLEDIQALRTLVREEIQQEMRPLRDQVGTLRDDMGGLRDQVGTLRDDMGGLRDEVRNMQGELKEVSARTARQGVTIRNLEHDNKTIRGDIQATKDAMMANFDTVNGNFAAIEERLDEHQRETRGNFEQLFAENETREQENLVIKHQLAELEKKVA